MEEDIKILEHYEIDVVEYPNGYKSVRDNKDNTFSKGIYIYATEEYGKNEIDNLLKNSIPKSKIEKKIEELEKWEYDDDYMPNLTIQDQIEVLRELLDDTKKD